MIAKPLESIELADLESLVSRRTAESTRLEFKRDLPGHTDAEKREFLADLTALANAHGGDLIYGIEAPKGEATSLRECDAGDVDHLKLQLENIIRDNTDPRLLGTKFKWIAAGAAGGFLLLRVPASLAAPHRVTFRGSSRFYSRNSSGKYEMDTHELRLAFSANEQLPDRLRSLHQWAVEHARGVDMPFGLHRGGPYVVLSIIPLSFFREKLDLQITFETTVLPPLEGNIRFLRTIDGILAYRAILPEGGTLAFSLLHWAGRLDSAWQVGRGDTPISDLTNLVWPHYFERGVVDQARAAKARLGDAMTCHG